MNEHMITVNVLHMQQKHCSRWHSCLLTRCLHEAIVAAIGRATDRRDDRLV